MPKYSTIDTVLKEVAKVSANASEIGKLASVLSASVVSTKKIIKEKERKIDVSALLSEHTGYIMTIEEANDFLEKAGIKHINVSLKPAEAKPEFRTYIDRQVTGVYPSCKIAPEDVLTVYYITEEVIERSQQMFDELEQKQNEDLSNSQTIKKQRSIKKNAATAIDRTKNGIKKVPKLIKREASHQDNGSKEE